MNANGTDANDQTSVCYFVGINLNVEVSLSDDSGFSQTPLKWGRLTKVIM